MLTKPKREENLKLQWKLGTKTGWEADLCNLKIPTSMCQLRTIVLTNGWSQNSGTSTKVLEAYTSFIVMTNCDPEMMPRYVVGPVLLLAWNTTWLKDKTWETMTNTRYRECCRTTPRAHPTEVKQNKSCPNSHNIPPLSEPYSPCSITSIHITCFQQNDHVLSPSLSCT